jgi:hypothetical protein
LLAARRALAVGSTQPRVATVNRRQSERSGYSLLASAPYEPGDQQVGEWTREQLTRMDERFVAAMERAIAAGRSGGRSGGSLTILALSVSASMQISSVCASLM